MTTTDEQLVWGRVTWRIMPLMVACMIIATIDRSNIGFAKLQMAGSLGLTEVVFGFGASLFYLGYIAFEIPSALASQRFGAPRWFARIMITWGIVTVLLGFTETREGFYLLRFLLGAAEAGLYPAQIFYLSLWFPPERRAGAMGLLTLGSAFGNSLSAVICAPLLELDAFGLQGWQWIFVITGLMPILMAPLALAVLPRGPQDATFLTDAQKTHVQAAVDDSLPKAQAHVSVVKALLTTRLIWPIIVYVGLMISLYGVIY